jgi:hypothetical protein
VHSIDRGVSTRLGNAPVKQLVVHESTKPTGASIYDPQCSPDWKPSGVLPAVADAFSFLQVHPDKAVQVNVRDRTVEGHEDLTVVLIGEKHLAFRFSENVCGSPVLVRLIHKECTMFDRTKLAIDAQKLISKYSTSAPDQQLEMVVASEGAFVRHLADYMQHVQLSYDESHAKFVGVVQGGEWSLLAEFERRAAVCI